MADSVGSVVLGNPAQEVDVSKLTREDVLRLIGQKSQKIKYVPKESKRSKSDAWNRFDAVLVEGKDTNFVKCKSCDVVYRFTPKIGTSNLVNHKCSDVTVSKRHGAPKEAEAVQGQKRITAFTAKIVPSHCIDELNETIVTGLAKDLRPLRTVDRKSVV